jgi:hypothetical protein
MGGKYIGKGGKYIGKGGKYIGKTKYKCKFRPPVMCIGDDERFGDETYQSSIMRLERYENIKDSMDRLQEIDPENKFTSKIIKVCPIGDLTEEEEGADQFTECLEEENLLKEKVYPFKDDDELVNIIQKYAGESVMKLNESVNLPQILELFYNYDQIIDILIILRDNDFCLTEIKDVLYDFKTHKYNINEVGWSFDMKFAPINIQLAMFALGDSDSETFLYFDLLAKEPDNISISTGDGLDIDPHFDTDMEEQIRVENENMSRPNPTLHEDFPHLVIDDGLDIDPHFDTDMEEQIRVENENMSRPNPTLHEDFPHLVIDDVPTCHEVPVAETVEAVMEEIGVNREVHDMRILILLINKLTDNEPLLVYIQIVKEVRSRLVSKLPSHIDINWYINEKLQMLILTAPNTIWPPDIGITLVLQHILTSLDKHPDECDKFVNLIKHIFNNIYLDYNIVSEHESDPAILIGKAKEFISNSLKKFDTYTLGMSNFINFLKRGLGMDIIKAVISKKELYDEFYLKFYNLSIELINPNPIERISLEEAKVKYSEITDILKRDAAVQLPLHRHSLSEEERLIDKWSCDIDEGCIKKPFGKYKSLEECDLECIDCFDGTYQDEDVFECPQCHNKICREFLKGIIRVAHQPNIREIAVPQQALRLFVSAAKIIILFDEILGNESNPVLIQVKEKATLSLGQIDLLPEQLPTNEEIYIIWNEMKNSRFFDPQFTTEIPEFTTEILAGVQTTLNQLSVLLTLNLSEDGMNIHQYPSEPPKCPYCRNFFSDEWISENVD